MCDYSLEQVQSRDAVVADRVVTTSFPNTLTRGFADVNDPRVAVCLRPGTESRLLHRLDTRVNGHLGRKGRSYLRAVP